MDDVARSDVEDAAIAFTADRAAELAGISRARLARLEAKRLVPPSVRRQLSERNTVRLYDFTDLEALMVVVLLEDSGLSLRHVDRVVKHLREQRGYASPLKELHFAVERGPKKRIYFRHADGSWEGEDRHHQIVIQQVIPLDAIRTKIRREAWRSRSGAEVGRVERRRRALGSRPVFKGTRIPIDGVVEFVQAGAGDDEILHAFPRLTPADIELARKRARAS